MKNTWVREDVQCPFVHQGCKTWLHWAIEHLPVDSEPTWYHDFISLKVISQFFLIISHFASRLYSGHSHMKNSVFNCMCISTINQQTSAVRHVRWLQARRRAGKWRKIPPVSFKREAMRVEVPFFIIVSWVISWFIKIDLKRIYCSYSRVKKIQNGFL